MRRDEKQARTESAGSSPRRRFSGKYHNDRLLARDSSGGVRLNLSVDVDGPKPLHLVRGTVTSGTGRGRSSDFMTRARTRRRDGRVLHLVLDGLAVRWPDSPEAVTALDVELRQRPGEEPVATVRPRTDRGELPPIGVERHQEHFRSVEVQIDHERGAPVVETYRTHAHPDRPREMRDQVLTLERTFADAGITLTRSATARELESSAAGEDFRWSQRELHDAMTVNWQSFANRPQWKMWILLAKVADKSKLGGIMFDADIDEPGGVDRQGTALFTKCDYFFSPQGPYASNNAPADVAAERELFFTLVHEMGHAFNLVHCADRTAGHMWHPAGWPVPHRSPSSLSYMNYPNLATPHGLGGASASWFYRRFTFAFERPELLFLRHGPSRAVEMGGEAWGKDQARSGLGRPARGLQLAVRSRKDQYEPGERVILELRLKNVGTDVARVHDELHPNEGFVQVTVTGPNGRQLHRPPQQSRKYVVPRELQPGAAVYQRVDLTVGLGGFAFKAPGSYTISARYVNLDGTTLQGSRVVHVRKVGPHEGAAVKELFTAEVGRVYTVEGSRVMPEVNERLDWVRQRLGPTNPISMHLATMRFAPLAHSGAVIDPSSGQIRRDEGDPEEAIRFVADLLGDQADTAADTLGHIGYVRLAERFVGAAERAGRQDLVAQSQRRVPELLASRSVPQDIVEDVQRKLRPA